MASIGQNSMLPIQLQENHSVWARKLQNESISYQPYYPSDQIATGSDPNPRMQHYEVRYWGTSSLNQLCITL
jgi:hypothetical protein